MWVRSAASRDTPDGPRPARAARAIDSALETDLAAVRGSRPGNSSSQARSRLIRRPGLTRTSWQSRRAVGRGHGPAARPPEATENGPSSPICTAGSRNGAPALGTDMSPSSRTPGAREHRGNSVVLPFRLGIEKGSEMNSGYMIFQAERTKSAAEQRQIDANHGEMAATLARRWRTLTRPARSLRRAWRRPVRPAAEPAMAGDGRWGAANSAGGNSRSLCRAGGGEVLAGGGEVLGRE